MVGGVLYVDDVKQSVGVVLEAMSSNEVTKYTAIKWAPSGIASCNCPGWTTNTKHKGKGLAARSCKHTVKVKGMTQSVYLVNSILPQSTQPVVGNTERSGRSIELD
jgi:hypothetical protein